MREPRNAVQRVTITVTKRGEQPITMVRYFHGYERLSLGLLLDAGPFDMMNHVLEVGDELVIAVDTASPTSG